MTRNDSFDETYDFFCDTLQSYLDQDEPDALDRFLVANRRTIFGVDNFGALTADYVALALYQLVRLRSGSFLSHFLRDGRIPEWGLIRPHLEVHRDAHNFIKSFEKADPETLSLAVLITLRYREDGSIADGESEQSADDETPYDVNDESYESDYN